MSKKWSEKAEKLSLVNDDELMILDSQDPFPDSKNKRVKVSTLLNNGPGSFSVQTVGAMTYQKEYHFTGAICVLFLISANNVGNTKGLSAAGVCNATLTNAHDNFSIDAYSDFFSTNVSVFATSSTLVLNLNGEAGETINWKVTAIVVSI